MSGVKSILKRGKRREENSPKRYNGLLEFKHQGIVSSSSEDEILIGCEMSDTLYLETATKETMIGMILSGNYGRIYGEVMQKRFQSLSSSSVLFSFDKNITSSLKFPTIEIPEDKRNIRSFLQGEKWYQLNEARIKSYVEGALKHKSLAFIILDNNPFMLGIMTKVIEHIVELKIQPILFVNLPADTTKIVEEFSCLTFIYNLLKKDRDLDVPIVLIDEKQLSKINTVESSESLLEKMQLRQANVVLDLLVGAQVPSTFYQVDFSNFERIFTNFTGICQLFSWDIYDNNPDISTLFKSKSEAKSFSCKDIPTRGFVCLQPGPNGLKTKVYQEIRKNYENSDVILSVLERREQGALIRGIFSNLPAPKLLTDKYSTLSRFNINLYNLEDQIIDFNTKEVLEKVIKANFFEISLIEDVQKLESDQ